MCLETRGRSVTITMKGSKLVPLPRGDKNFPCGVTSYLVCHRVQKEAQLPPTCSPHTAGMLNRIPTLLPVPSVVSSLTWYPVYLLPTCVMKEQNMAWQEFSHLFFFFLFWGRVRSEVPLRILLCWGIQQNFAVWSSHWNILKCFTTQPMSKCSDTSCNCHLAQWPQQRGL